MFSTLFTVALFFAPALQGVLAEFAVATPESITQCQDVKLTWEETKGPYTLFLLNPEDPCGDEIANLGEIDKTYHTFQAKVPQGLQVQIYIEDADGDEAWSGPLTVGKSDDASCVPTELKDKGTPEPASESAKPSGTPAAAPSPTPAAAGASKPPAQASASPSVAPIGAANAGTNPFSTSGASSVRHISTPLLGFSAIAALVVFSL